jgi:hypothetical protein
MANSHMAISHMAVSHMAIDTWLLATCLLATWLFAAWLLTQHFNNKNINERNLLIINLHIVITDQQIGLMLSRDIQLSYRSFAKELLTSCDENPKVADIPIQVPYILTAHMPCA